jgi:hypothetical protein
MPKRVSAPVQEKASWLPLMHILWWLIWEGPLSPSVSLPA